MKSDMSDSERELRKKLDIVYRVFKEASKKLNRVDRCWQEVIDSQVYIIDELKNESVASITPVMKKSRKEKA